MRHKFRHILTLFLILTLLLPTIIISVTAAVENENNNSLNHADSIQLSETVHGELNPQNDKDMFGFTIPTAGEIVIGFTAYIERYDFYLFDENGKQMFVDRSIFWNEASGMSFTDFTFDLLPGNYFISVTDTYFVGEYSFDIQFTEATVTEDENNDDIRSAQPVEINETMYAFMHFDSTPDNFVFTVPSSGTYYIAVDSYTSNIELSLLDKNGSRIWYKNSHLIYGDTHEYKSYEFSLDAGTYYFSVRNNANSTSSDGRHTGEYNFRIYSNSSSPVVPPSSNNDSSSIFSDVPSNAWYKIYIDFSITINIFTGTSSTTFSPDMAMNRAMLVTVLWRLEGNPYVNCNLPFSDVPENTWYSEAVEWAYLNGIVKGTSATTFSPNVSITREQIATILYRYGTVAKSLNLNERNSLNSFPDGNKTNDFAWDALSWATAVEIINGANYGGGIILDPQGVATRAQVAKILTVFYNNYMV